MAGPIVDPSSKKTVNVFTWGTCCDASPTTALESSPPLRQTPSGTSLFEARFGYSKTEAGKNRPGLGTDDALKQFTDTLVASQCRYVGSCAVLLCPATDLHGIEREERRAVRPAIAEHQRL